MTLTESCAGRMECQWSVQTQWWPGEALNSHSRAVDLVLVDPLHHHHLMVHLCTIYKSAYRLHATPSTPPACLWQAPRDRLESQQAHVIHHTYACTLRKGQCPGGVQAMIDTSPHLRCLGPWCGPYGEGERCTQPTCMSDAGSRKSDPQCASTIFMSFSMVGKRRLFTRIRKSLTCHSEWLGQQILYKLVVKHDWHNAGPLPMICRPPVVKGPRPCAQ